MKISRNQPCPCGSGKRFKHCCGVLNNQTSFSSPSSSVNWHPSTQPQNTTLPNQIEMAYHYLQTGQSQKAEEIYRQILLVKPDFAEGYNGLGEALNAQNKLDEAIECYHRALQLKPDFINADKNLGNAFRIQGKLEKARLSFRRVLEQNPNDASTQIKLATLRPVIMGLPPEILASRQQFLENVTTLLKSNIKEHARNNFDNLPQPLLINEGSSPALIRRGLGGGWVSDFVHVPKLNEPDKETGMTNFYFAYHGLNDRDLQVKLATLYEQVCPSLLYSASHCLTPSKSIKEPARNNLPNHPLSPWRGNSPSLIRRGLGGGYQSGILINSKSSKPIKNRKIKIGFISKYFNNHTIGKVMCGIIANLSRDKFESYVFFLSHAVDELTDFIMQNANHFESLPLNLDKARQQIADKRLDILCYPEIGMDSFTYFLAFSRLAPIQCTTWGHPVTSGIRNIDYFISTQDLEVTGAEEHYSEKLIRLKSHHLTFYYKPTLPRFLKCRRDFGLEDQDHIYLCPQALFKFHPDFDFVLAKILENDLKGQILLPEGTHPHWTELLKNRFKQTIPPTVIERIRFIKRMTLGDYFNLIALSDVMLDPFPFGGGNTSYEALAVGIPIVTLPTKLMRGRLTYACYRQMGLMDCVAENPQNYIEIALRLGTQSSFQEQIKAKILATHNLLYEDINVIQEFEKCFWEWVMGNR